MTNINYYYPISYTLPDLSEEITLSKVLSEKISSKYKNLSIGDSILVLISYVQIITTEELACYFRFTTWQTFNAILSRLKDQGKVLGVTLYPQREKKGDCVDGRSTTGYVLSKKGFEEVKKKYREDLGEYRRAGSSKYNLHNYSNGWNYVALLASPFLYQVGEFDSELLFAKGMTTSAFNVANNLRIDGRFVLGGDTVYLEQDMGNESIEYLRNKFNLYGYQYHNLQTGNSSVVLSIKKPYVALMEPGMLRAMKNMRFSVRGLIETVTCMEENKDKFDLDNVFYDDFYKLYESGEITSPHPELVKAVYEDIYRMKYGQNTGTDEDRLPLLVNKYTLRTHALKLKGYVSNIYFYEYNKIQEEFCIKKRNKLIENILSGGIGEDGKRPSKYDIDPYLSGFHVYVGATTLMDKVLYFSYMYHSGFNKALENTLLQYFPSLDVNSYQKQFIVRSDSPYKRADAPINLFSLCNYYQSDSWNICIENLSYDISASVRVKAAITDFDTSYQKGRKGLVILCLVTDDADALYFSKLLGISSIPAKSSFKVLFLNIRDALSQILVVGDIEQVRPKEIFRYNYDHLYWIDLYGEKQIIEKRKA